MLQNKNFDLFQVPVIQGVTGEWRRATNKTFLRASGQLCYATKLHALHVLYTKERLGWLLARLVGQVGYQLHRLGWLLLQLGQQARLATSYINQVGYYCSQVSRLGWLLAMWTRLATTVRSQVSRLGWLLATQTRLATTAARLVGQVGSYCERSHSTVINKIKHNLVYSKCLQIQVNQFAGKVLRACLYNIHIVVYSQQFYCRQNKNGIYFILEFQHKCGMKQIHVYNMYNNLFNIYIIYIYIYVYIYIYIYIYSQIILYMYIYVINIIIDIILI